jgi:hypothetical protein
MPVAVVGKDGENLTLPAASGTFIEGHFPFAGAVLFLRFVLP